MTTAIKDSQALIQPSRVFFIFCALFISTCLLSSCAVRGLSAERPEVGTDSTSWASSTALTALIDRLTASEMTTTTPPKILINGVDAFARRYENLRSARVVLVKTFIFSSDEEGQRMAAALTDATARGVEVVLQYDVKGSVGGAQDITDMLEHATQERPAGEKPILHALRDAGVHVLQTNAPANPESLRSWWDSGDLTSVPPDVRAWALQMYATAEHSDHEKMFITLHDNGEVRAIVGGMNTATEYALGGVPNRVDPVTLRAGWRDTDVELGGAIARQLINDFIADWSRHTDAVFPPKISSAIDTLTASTPPGNVPVRLVTNHPRADDTRHIEELYRLLLLAAPSGEPVVLVAPYFSPSKPLREAIIERGKAGGVVTLLTNSLDSNDVSLLTDAAYFAIYEVLKETENFHAYEWIPRDAEGEHTVHQKVATFGARGPVIIGSFNLDAQSALHNTELVTVIHDSATRASTDAMLLDDLSTHKARRITREYLETAPAQERIKRFLLHELAWYWL